MFVRSSRKHLRLRADRSFSDLVAAGVNTDFMPNGNKLVVPILGTIIERQTGSRIVQLFNFYFYRLGLDDIILGIHAFLLPENGDSVAKNFESSLRQGIRDPESSSG